MVGGRMTRVLVVALLVGSLGFDAGCAQPYAPPAAGASGGRGAATQCTGDDECKGDRVCQDGTCEAPAVEAAVIAAIAAGDIALANLKPVVAHKMCPAAPGVERALDELGAAQDGEQLADLAKRIGGPEPASELDQSEMFGDWLLTVWTYRRQCNEPLGPKQLAQAATATAAVVPEDAVEATVRRNDCASLIAIDSAKMWPYEQRFSREVVDKKFTDAEVTRKVWIASLKSFSTECVKRLNQRQRIAVETRLQTLEGIVGLNDALLVDLRSKMLAAMDTGNANEVATLAQAISEREGVLGKRRSESDARAMAQQLEYQRRLAEKRRMLAEAQRGRERPAGQAAQPDKPAGSEANVLDDVNKVVDTVNNVTNTVNTVSSLFGL